MSHSSTDALAHTGNANEALTPAHEPVLRANNVGITIEGRSIVANVSFSLSRESSLAIIGPNGSGKTLLLKSLLGLRPHEGNIRWLPGVKLGYVPQNVSTDPHLPLRVIELLRAKQQVMRLSIKEVPSAVHWVGIENLLDQRLGALSTGQLQRVLIAFALVGSPDVLLVDEPTSSLDELAEEHIFELIQRIRLERGVTLVLVSHDLALVRDIATHVLCLSGMNPLFGTAGEMLTPEILERVYGTPLEFHTHHLEHHR